MGKKNKKKSEEVKASFALGDVNDDAAPTTSTERKVNFHVTEESHYKRKSQHGDTNGVVNGTGRLRHSPSAATLNRLDRQNIVIWYQPFLTIRYCIYELALKIIELWQIKASLVMPILFVLSLMALYFTEGPHQPLVDLIRKKFLTCAYWLGLGIMSSIGLGTGLHTFLLYLGPFIAKVTLAAYECNSLAFPEPPYPDELICPDSSETAAGGAFLVSLWSIMSKVRLEAFMWGAGTAIGELPPYFMARAARISGEESDNPEYQEFLRFMSEQEDDREETFLGRLKLKGERTIEKIVENVGFFGILLCASIPNPLFDLAGITCGHFLVPFWTFFTATLIGKAVIKMHIQKLFVIIAFSEHHVENLVSIIGDVPHIGQALQAPFKDFLAKQKASLHGKAAGAAAKGSLLGDLFAGIVLIMILYFVLSIINSMAQAYHARLWERGRAAREKTQ